MQIINEGKANAYPMPGIDITISSPQNITYNDNTVPVAFTATEVHIPSGVTFAYSLDDKERKPIINITSSSEIFPIGGGVYFKTMKGNFLLFNLSEGWHTITIYCHTEHLSNSYDDEDAIDFFVETIPTVSFLPYQNRTFETSDVPLNFTVNQAFSKITCSLDGEDNMTIKGNTTLSDLSYGEHNVTVFVTDTNGNTGASETLLFTIAEPIAPFPTALVVATASVIIIVIVVIAFFLLMRKHKH